MANNYSAQLATLLATGANTDTTGRALDTSNLAVGFNAGPSAVLEGSALYGAQAEQDALDRISTRDAGEVAQDMGASLVGGAGSVVDMLTGAAVGTAGALGSDAVARGQISGTDLKGWANKFKSTADMYDEMRYQRMKQTAEVEADIQYQDDIASGVNTTTAAFRKQGKLLMSSLGNMSAGQYADAASEMAGQYLATAGLGGLAGKGLTALKGSAAYSKATAAASKQMGEFLKEGKDLLSSYNLLDKAEVLGGQLGKLKALAPIMPTAGDLVGGIMTFGEKQSEIISTINSAKQQDLMKHQEYLEAYTQAITDGKTAKEADRIARDEYISGTLQRALGLLTGLSKATGYMESRAFTTGFNKATGKGGDLGFGFKAALDNMYGKKGFMTSVKEGGSEALEDITTKAALDRVGADGAYSADDYLQGAGESFAQAFAGTYFSPFKGGNHPVGTKSDTPSAEDTPQGPVNTTQQQQTQRQPTPINNVPVDTLNQDITTKGQDYLDNPATHSQDLDTAVDSAKQELRSYIQSRHYQENGSTLDEDTLDKLVDQFVQPLVDDYEGSKKTPQDGENLVNGLGAILQGIPHVQDYNQVDTSNNSPIVDSITSSLSSLGSRVKDTVTSALDKVVNLKGTIKAVKARNLITNAIKHTYGWAEKQVDQYVPDQAKRDELKKFLSDKLGTASLKQLAKDIGSKASGLQSVDSTKLKNLIKTASDFFKKAPESGKDFVDYLVNLMEQEKQKNQQQQSQPNQQPVDNTEPVESNDTHAPAPKKEEVKQEQPQPTEEQKTEPEKEQEPEKEPEQPEQSTEASPKGNALNAESTVDIVDRDAYTTPPEVDPDLENNLPGLDQEYTQEQSDREFKGKPVTFTSPDDVPALNNSPDFDKNLPLYEANTGSSNQGEVIYAQVKDDNGTKRVVYFSDKGHTLSTVPADTISTKRDPSDEELVNAGLSSVSFFSTAERTFRNVSKVQSTETGVTPLNRFLSNTMFGRILSAWFHSKSKLAPIVEFALAKGMSVYEAVNYVLDHPQEFEHKSKKSFILSSLINKPDVLKGIKAYHMDSRWTSVTEALKKVLAHEFATTNVENLSEEELIQKIRNGEASGILLLAKGQREFTADTMQNLILTVKASLPALLTQSYGTVAREDLFNELGISTVADKEALAKTLENSLGIQTARETIKRIFKDVAGIEVNEGNQVVSDLLLNAVADTILNEILQANNVTEGVSGSPLVLKKHVFVLEDGTSKEVSYLTFNINYSNDIKTRVKSDPNKVFNLSGVDAVRELQKVDDNAPETRTGIVGVLNDLYATFRLGTEDVQNNVDFFKLFGTGLMHTVNLFYTDLISTRPREFALSEDGNIDPSTFNNLEGTHANEQQKKAADEMSKQAFHINPVVERLANVFGLTGIASYLGIEVSDWSPAQATLDGRRTTLMTAWNYFQALAGAVKEAAKDGDFSKVGIHFGTLITSTSRLMQKGPATPQSNKFMREALSLNKPKQIEYFDNGSLFTNTEALGEIKAILQRLGFSSVAEQLHYAGDNAPESHKQLAKAMVTALRTLARPSFRSSLKAAYRPLSVLLDALDKDTQHTSVDGTGLNLLGSERKYTANEVKAALKLFLEDTLKSNGISEDVIADLDLDTFESLVAISSGIELMKANNSVTAGEQFTYTSSTYFEVDGPADGPANKVALLATKPQKRINQSYQNLEKEQKSWWDNISVFFAQGGFQFLRNAGNLIYRSLPDTFSAPEVGGKIYTRVAVLGSQKVTEGIAKANKDGEPGPEKLFRALATLVPSFYVVLPNGQFQFTTNASKYPVISDAYGSSANGRSKSLLEDTLVEINQRIANVLNNAFEVELNLTDHMEVITDLTSTFQQVFQLREALGLPSNEAWSKLEKLVFNFDATNPNQWISNLRETLQRNRKEYAQLSDEIFTESAKVEGSPLHRFKTWISDPLSNALEESHGSFAQSGGKLLNTIAGLNTLVSNAQAEVIFQGLERVLQTTEADLRGRFHANDPKSMAKLEAKLQDAGVAYLKAELKKIADKNLSFNTEGQNISDEAIQNLSYAVIQYMMGTADKFNPAGPKENRIFNGRKLRPALKSAGVRAIAIVVQSLGDARTSQTLLNQHKLKGVNVFDGYLVDATHIEDQARDANTAALDVFKLNVYDQQLKLLEPILDLLQDPGKAGNLLKAMQSSERLNDFFGFVFSLMQAPEIDVVVSTVDSGIIAEKVRQKLVSKGVLKDSDPLPPASTYTVSNNRNQLNVMYYSLRERVRKATKDKHTLTVSGDALVDQILNESVMEYYTSHPGLFIPLVQKITQATLAMADARSDFQMHVAETEGYINKFGGTTSAYQKIDGDTLKIDSQSLAEAKANRTRIEQKLQSLEGNGLNIRYAETPKENPSLGSDILDLLGFKTTRSDGMLRATTLGSLMKSFVRHRASFSFDKHKALIQSMSKLGKATGDMKVIAIDFTDVKDLTNTELQGLGLSAEEIAYVKGLEPTQIGSVRGFYASGITNSPGLILINTAQLNTTSALAFHETLLHEVYHAQIDAAVTMHSRIHALLGGLGTASDADKKEAIKQALGLSNTDTGKIDEVLTAYEAFENILKIGDSIPKIRDMAIKAGMPTSIINALDVLHTLYNNMMADKANPDLIREFVHEMMAYSMTDTGVSELFSRTKTEEVNPSVLKSFRNIMGRIATRVLRFMGVRNDIINSWVKLIQEGGVSSNMDPSVSEAINVFSNILMSSRTYTVNGVPTSTKTSELYLAKGSPSVYNRTVNVINGLENNLGNLPLIKNLFQRFSTTQVNPADVQKKQQVRDQYWVDDSFRNPLSTDLRNAINKSSLFMNNLSPEQWAETSEAVLYFAKVGVHDSPTLETIEQIRDAISNLDPKVFLDPSDTGDLQSIAEQRREEFLEGKYLDPIWNQMTKGSGKEIQKHKDTMKFLMNLLFTAKGQEFLEMDMRTKGSQLDQSIHDIIMDKISSSLNRILTVDPTLAGSKFSSLREFLEREAANNYVKSNQYDTNISDMSPGLFNTMNKGLKDLYERITNKKWEDIGKATQTLVERWGLSDFAKRYPELQRLLRDFYGRRDDTKNIMARLSEVRAIVGREMNRYLSGIPASIREAFKGKLTNVQDKKLHTLLVKTDLQAITSLGVISHIQDIILDPNVRKQEIQGLENDLNSRVHEDKANNIIYPGIKALAKFMMSGELSSTAIMNPHDIIRQAYPKMDPNSADYAKLFELIDKLTSLEALNLVPAQYIEDLKTHIKNKDGMQTALGFLQNYARSQEAKMNAQDNYAKFNYRKGGYPSHRSSEQNGKIVTKESFDKGSFPGYKIVPNVAIPSLPGSPELVLISSPFDTSASFMSGILQTTRDTAMGVDYTTGIIHGNSNTIIKDATAIKAYLADPSSYNTGEVGYIPLRTPDGSVYGLLPYSHPKLSGESYENSLTDSAARGYVRNLTEEVSGQLNLDSVDLLGKEYERSKANGTDKQWVNIYESKDPLILDAISKMSNDVKARGNQVFGAGIFMVPADAVDVVIGRRDASVKNLWSKNLGDLNGFHRAVRQVAELLFGANALRYMIAAEKAIRYGVATAKDIIVVKSGIVALGNIMSNIFQLIAEDVPISYILTSIPKLYREMQQFKKLESEIIKTKSLMIKDAQSPLSLQAHQERLDKLEKRKQKSLFSKIAEAGQLTSILDSADIAGSSGYDDSHLTGGSRLKRYGKSLAKNALIMRGTPTYALFSEVAQAGDIIAKAIMLQYLTKDAPGPSLLNEEVAIQKVSEAFVDYNLPSGRYREYAERMGLLWFFNYKIRMSKIAAKLIYEKPFSAGLAILAPATLGGLIPGLNEFSSSNLFSDSALALDRGYGPGMLLRSFDLHPLMKLM